jgi:hypothetical protein
VRTVGPDHPWRLAHDHPQLTSRQAATQHAGNNGQAVMPTGRCARGLHDPELCEAVLSLLTAAVAATFVKQDEKPEELRAELREIASRLDRIERALGEREASDYPEVVSSFIGSFSKSNCLRPARSRHQAVMGER